LEPFCHLAVEKCNLPYIPKEKHLEAEERLKTIPVSAVWSSASSMEITHPEAQKGTALKALCRLLKIPVEQAMALGDSGNDESMLKTAGLGIAMGNAPEYIQAIADAVTQRSEHDGAAIAIEHYALNL
jgi:hydroxymethylpyrimidine pyrophosphatase-like HAD family hydrolase